MNRRVAEQDQKEIEAEADAQKYRVLNAVRSLYYQALVDQRLIEVRTDLAKLARRAVDISRELANVGQADRPDLLAADIEAERIELELVTAQNARERTWRQLAAVVNNPILKPTPLKGDLENPPKLDVEQALEKIFNESPELRRGCRRYPIRVGVRRAKWRRFWTACLGGVRYNRELWSRRGRWSIRRWEKRGSSISV